MLKNEEKNNGKHHEKNDKMEQWNNEEKSKKFIINWRKNGKTGKNCVTIKSEYYNKNEEKNDEKFKKWMAKKYEKAKWEND